MKQKTTRQTGIFSSSENRVWTISELTSQVRLLLENEFSPITVAGEISAITKASSGHLYFQLKDDKCAIDAVMFRFSVARMKGIVPSDGMQVQCTGRMTMYEPRGKTQLVVERMSPLGEGVLALRLEQLKQRLLQEGLFDRERKQPLPAFPKVVGVVTSPTGAAIRDILKVMARRFPSVHVLIAPALVQGDSAPGQIANGIHLLESTGRVDVIIVGRGGGSLEDLWAFNEEEVVRAVAECSVPIVSAVGHETDTVLSDLAADLRAPTPSAAAEIVVQDRQELRQVIESLKGQMARAIEWKTSQARADLQQLQSKMQDPRVALAHHRMKLDDIARSMAKMLMNVISSNRSSLSELRVKLATFEPNERLRRERQKILALRHRLDSATTNVLVSKRTTLVSRKEALMSLSPLAVLNRGYSLVYGPDGKLLRDAGVLRQGDMLRVRPSRGSVTARVEEPDGKKLNDDS